MLDEQLRVLVVDDDRIDREIYRRCLLQTVAPRFELTESDSAAAGIQQARTSGPDCILLDYDLPDMNGLEVLNRLKGEGDAVPCAIVMLTAFGGETLAVQAMKAGVMDYLPKRQVAGDILAHTVVNAVQKFQMERRLAAHRSALASSEERNEMLLEAMPQMVWTANSEGLVQYANRRWLEYTGLSLEAAGRLGWDKLLHPEDRESTWSAWQTARNSGCTFESEHRLRRASDQSYRWHLVRAVPMKNGHNEITAWFGTCTEVESQKQAEKATLEREKAEGLGLLAGGIAHDFNNLLMGILGGASFVMDALPATDPSRRTLADVMRAAQRAAELTRKMLTYSGRGNFVVERIDVNQLARDTCRLLRLGLPKRINLRFQSEGGLPPVETDAAQLRQVLVELVMNAVEAIAENDYGSISMRTRLAGPDGGAREQHLEKSVAAGVPLITLEVADTGCGMDQETQSKIFDPFFSTKFTGRGMGLSAVQGFVRSNKGAIRVRSAPGQGSTFQVVLPAAVEKAMEEKSDSAGSGGH